MQNSRQSGLEAVLADCYLKNVATCDAFISNIPDKKKTSMIMSQLSKLYPMKDLLHLKRIRSCKEQGGALQIIVCKCSQELSDADVSASIKNIEGLGKPYIVKVPSSPALTRHQFNEASKFWPINFHEDKGIAALVSGSCLNDKVVQDAEKYMKMAIQLAGVGKEHNQYPVGAVIVDPSTQTVIAEACDLRLAGYPLQHAVMVAIDLVAHSQEGGMWKFDDVHTDLTRWCKREIKEGSAGEEYLCTGYDLYITQEPCVMCSMALVHARIGRVFYGSSYSGGALGSVYKVHCQEGFNHHYLVFKGCLKEETDEFYQSEDDR